MGAKGCKHALDTLTHNDGHITVIKVFKVVDSSVTAADTIPRDAPRNVTRGNVTSLRFRRFATLPGWHNAARIETSSGTSAGACAVVKILRINFLLLPSQKFRLALAVKGLPSS